MSNEKVICYSCKNEILLPEEDVAKVCLYCKYIKDGTLIDARFKITELTILENRIVARIKNLITENK